MAAKGKNNGRQNQRSWQGSELSFASRRLSREEGEAFIEWYKSSAPAFEDALFKIVNALYKVQFRVDLNNNAQVCAFTQQDDRHIHANVYLTSRSDDAVEAFFMNCYKVWFIYADKPITTDQKLDELWG